LKFRLKKPNELKIGSGLYLPPGVPKEKEKVQQGYIIKLGSAGYFQFSYGGKGGEDGRSRILGWKTEEKKSNYMVPLQAKRGGLAIFLLAFRSSMKVNVLKEKNI